MQQFPKKETWAEAINRICKEWMASEAMSIEEKNQLSRKNWQAQELARRMSED